MFPVNAILVLLFVPLWDWICIDKIALEFSGNPYRYWPLTGPRLISLLLLEIAAVSGCFLPDRQMWWWLALFLIAIAIWLIVAIRDMITKP